MSRMRFQNALPERAGQPFVPAVQQLHDSSGGHESGSGWCISERFRKSGNRRCISNRFGTEYLVSAVRVYVLESFKIFRAASILTLVLMLFLFVLGLFNQHEVMFSLFGYRHKAVSMYFIVLWSFLAGAVFVGTLWILYVVKNFMTIKSLKKTILDLKEKENQTVF